jgi:hypothetical protein
MSEREIIKQILVRLRRLESQPSGGGGGGGGEFTFLRPDGISGYIRPSGPYTYIRP